MAVPDAPGTDPQSLALWAMRYSPLVSLCRHQRAERVGVVAEVAGSAHLFGGLDHLLADARAQVLALSPDAICAGAPSASGAWALACCASDVAWADARTWPQRLAALPLMALDLPDSDHELLTQVGLRRVGECMKLPRGDLDRRCRTALSTHLDQLSGTAPEPRLWFVPPATYDRSVELLHETWHTDALLFTGRRLLGELEGLLRGCGRAVQVLRFTLGHAPGQPDTTFDLALTRPLQDLTPVAGLLRERLSRLRLPSPVRRVGLAATPLESWQAQSPELWPGPEETALQRSALLDRLRARLGEEAVCSLTTVADHRPEAAWRAAPAADGARPRRTAALPSCRGLRPLWLLPEPSPLADTPGDWQEERGPERIEAGWWQSPVARDYYVLRDACGRRLWAFRTARGDWFAHGWFA
jgi:protein ImuB